MSSPNAMIEDLDDISALLFALSEQCLTDIANAITITSTYGRTIHIVCDSPSRAMAHYFAERYAHRTSTLSGVVVSVSALIRTDGELSIVLPQGQYLRPDQFAMLLQPGDLAIVTTTSDVPQKLSEMLELATLRGAITIGVAGQRGRGLMHLTEHCVLISTEHAIHIESIQFLIYQTVAAMVEQLRRE